MVSFFYFQYFKVNWYNISGSTRYSKGITVEAWLHHQGEGRNLFFFLESVGIDISCHTVLSSLSVRPPGLCERYTSGTRHFLKQYLVLSYCCLSGWFYYSFRFLHFNKKVVHTEGKRCLDTA